MRVYNLNMFKIYMKVYIVAQIDAEDSILLIATIKNDRYLCNK